MIGLPFVYTLIGLLFAGAAAIELGRREDPARFRKAALWGLFSLSFLAGDWVGDLANGGLVVALALLAGLGRLNRRPSAALLKGPPARASILFIAVLIVPAGTLVGSLLLSRVVVVGRPLLDPRQAAPVSLALGTLLALGFIAATLRPRPLAPLGEAGRLLDAVGWAALLPQTLAALGAVFALAGVGAEVGALAARYLPVHERLGAVIAYTFGMAGFTILMGNAFAAFPVMTSAIGMPLIVARLGGDPAVVGAVGMLSGFCGTLVTPMAANFNLVPAALLELDDRWGVIRAQAPTAGLLLLANTAILYFAAFGGRPVH